MARGGIYGDCDNSQSFSLDTSRFEVPGEGEWTEYRGGDCAILDEAVEPPEGQVGLGTALRNWALEHLHGEELVIERDTTPGGWAEFD